MELLDGETVIATEQLAYTVPSQLISIDPEDVLEERDDVAMVVRNASSSLSLDVAGVHIPLEKRSGDDSADTEYSFVVPSLVHCVLYSSNASKYAKSKSDRITEGIFESIPNMKYI